MNSVYKVKTCRLCGSEKICSFDKLEKMPVGDSFSLDYSKSIQYRLYDVELMLCQECGQIQLSEVIEPEEIYNCEYLYSTNTSINLYDHFRDASEGFIKRYVLNQASFVLEVGSNEGVLLEFFLKKGIRVMGVDPASLAVEIAKKRGVETICDFFTQELAKKIYKEKGKADLVISNNVMANIPDMKSFIEAISIVLDLNGVFVFETSYAVDVIQKTLIDTVYHEHISYFYIAPLQSFFERYGFFIFDAEVIDTKGGSIRCHVARVGSRWKKRKEVDILIKKEKEFFSNLKDIKIKFVSNLEHMKKKIQKLILEIGEKKTIYGASVGGITMLYNFGLSNSIDLFVDDNVKKIGTYCPASGIPVKSSTILHEDESIQKVICFAWRFMDSIVEKNKAFLSRGGEFFSVSLKDGVIYRYCMNDGKLEVSPYEV